MPVGENGNGMSKERGKPSRKVGLKCFYVNARSLRNKKDELLSYIVEEDLDIVCITEAWVNEEQFRESRKEYEVDGYIMYLHQRTGKIGGGVVIYIKNSYTSSQVNDIKVDDRVESLWLDVKVNKNKVIRVGAFYRPPNQSSDVDELMAGEINKGCTRQTIILGDFNLRSVNWDTMVGDTSGMKFIETFQDKYLVQVVDKPTRGTEILDLVLTNIEHCVREVEVGETLGNSDHHIIRFIIAFSKDNIVNKTRVPNYQKGDYDRLRKLLAEINWKEILRDMTVQEMWDIFKGVLKDIVMQCIPFRAIRKGSRKPLWWTQEIGMKIREKKRAFSKLQITGEEVDLIRYRHVRDELSKIIKRSKREEEIKLARIGSKDPKTLFSYYKVSDRKNQDRIGPLRKDGVIAEQNEDMVELLNGHFSSVFTREREGNLGTGSMMVSSAVLDNINIDPGIIRSHILKLNDRKATGPDEIHARVLKEGADSLSEALSLIFDRSLRFTEIPQDWKLANVTPIFKKGRKDDASNYRPVSLTCVVCKLLERIIKDSVWEHLNKFRLIRDTQHGFRSGRSCLTNLLEFLEFITKQLDEGNNVDVIYLDFSKAFDKVPHRRLLHKLRSHGIGGGLVNWIGEWLTDRKQRVVLNGTMSGWKEVVSGVPQGSVLGPLLFLIYINDLDVGISSKISKFADDTKIASTVQGAQDNYRIQRDLNRLIAWADRWQMEFNAKKCQVMHLGRDNRNFSYEMEGCWLEAVEEEKDLGVVVDRALRFSKQCLEARNRANRTLGFINRNVSYKSKEVVRSLYNSYVRPHLEYCIQAWSPHYRQDINMLEAVQRRATRMIPALRRLEYRDRLKELNMFSFERRCLRGDMIELFKMFTDSNYIDVSTFFTLEEEGRTRGHGRKISKQGCRSNIRKYFFSHRVVDFWNALPERVVSSTSLGMFKSRLDEHMDEMDL